LASKKPSSGHPLMCNRLISSANEILEHYGIPYGFTMVAEIKYCIKLIDTRKKMAKKYREG
jgi:hypothetical protein